MKEPSENIPLYLSQTTQEIFSQVRAIFLIANFARLARERDGIRLIFLRLTEKK